MLQSTNTDPRLQNLELLLENGVLNDDQFESITEILPQETSLRSGNSRVASPAVSTPVPTDALARLDVSGDRGHHDPAPAYAANPTPPPRGPPPPKAEIARARALYRYAEANDCCFEPGDEIAVLEYMNNEWWLGRNLRTGKEGVFPVNYVSVVPRNDGNGYPNEKSAMGGNPYGGYQGGYQAPVYQQQAPQGNPYNNAVPPMAVAHQPEQQMAHDDGKASGGGKAGEMGKKFGKKLGNALLS